MKSNKLIVRFQELSGIYGAELAAHALSEKIPKDFLDKIPETVALEFCRALPDNNPVKLDFYDSLIDSYEEACQLIWLYKTIEHMNLSYQIESASLAKSGNKLRPMLDKTWEKIVACVYGELNPEQIRDLYDFFVHRTDGQKHIPHLISLVK